MAYVDRAAKQTAGHLRAGRVEIGQLKPASGALNYGAGSVFESAFSVWYGRLGTTAEEKYAAQQVNVSVDRRVRVRADKRISPTCAARIDSQVYRIARIFEEASGKFLDLSLSEVKA